MRVCSRVRVWCVRECVRVCVCTDCASAKGRYTYTYLPTYLHTRARAHTHTHTQVHVPFRGSALTRLLEDSMGGASQVAPCVCV